MSVSFVAIDFETANHQRCSPIQIGLTPVVDGVLGTPYVTAVLPPEGYRDFHPGCTAIHGLSPEYIIGAPEWPEIHARLVRYARGLPLVAHNASFERSVIRKTSEVCGFDAHAFVFHDTVKLARMLDPGSPNHKLNTLAERYGLDQHHHHDAGDDAFVGAKLALHLISLPGGERAFHDIGSL